MKEVLENSKFIVGTGLALSATTTFIMIFKKGE